MIWFTELFKIQLDTSSFTKGEYLYDQFWIVNALVYVQKLRV